MNTGVQAPAQNRPGTGRSNLFQSLLCVAAAVLAAATFPLIGNTMAPRPGDMTVALIEAGGRLELASLASVLASAGLVLAAVRLGRGIGGTAGWLCSAAGTLVAMLLALYVSSFGSGAVVASKILDSPTPGVAEATLVLANAVDLARYAPTLVLVAAVVAARHRVPRAVGLSAVALVIITVVPLTSWLAAVVVPVWLGVVATTIRPPQAAAA